MTLSSRLSLTLMVYRQTQCRVSRARAPDDGIISGMSCDSGVLFATKREMGREGGVKTLMVCIFQSLELQSTDQRGMPNGHVSCDVLCRCPND